MVYEKAGRKAMTEDEVCPATFDEGIRIQELAEEFVELIRELSLQRAPPIRIAASSLRFLVWRQPFKNCNHRTGYAMCMQILELFGYEMPLSKDEITEYIFSINRFNRSDDDVELWLGSNARKKPT
jgi:hypothetical protein